MTEPELRKCITDAYNSLPPCDRLILRRQAQRIVDRCRRKGDIRQSMTIGGALELLYRLGQWMNSNDKQP